MREEKEEADSDGKQEGDKGRQTESYVLCPWRAVLETGGNRCLVDAAGICVSAKSGWAPEFHMEWASVKPAAGEGQRERLPHPSWKNCPRRPHTCCDGGLKTGGSLSFTEASRDPAEAEQTACYLLPPRPPDRGDFVCAFR